MVKGISRQVIVVHSPDPKLFEQAIFILKDEAAKNGITDEALIKEAQQAVYRHRRPLHSKNKWYGLLWAGVGACLTGLVWAISAL